MLPVSDFKVRKKETYNLAGKIKVKVLVLFVLVVITLFTTQLVFANSLATDGQKLAEIESEIERLEAENTTLKAKIAQESSLVVLSQKAQDLGFNKPSKVIIP